MFATLRPPRPPAPSVARLQPTIYVRVCPDCAGPLVRNSGCIHCAQCGWARCG